MPLLFADDMFFEHDTGNHPESAARLRTVYRKLEQSRLAARFQQGTLSPATHEQLERVHSPKHIQAVRQLAESGGGPIDADTVVSHCSYEVALYAAGAAIAAVDGVLGGTEQRAACLCRPPGHHALPGRAMGFCLFNNVAVAARHALATFECSRLLIVDWDVHHGNGTQDIFNDSADVTFFSAHRHPFYPGTGLEHETGSGRGLGSTFNLPLAFGISRREYLSRFQTMLIDAARRCRPELVLISAGFDAHTADPIGSLGLESEDFAALTQMVADVADTYCQGRIVSLLEGGYNVLALAESVACHLDALVPESAESE